MSETKRCHAISRNNNLPGLESWCSENCANSYCPPSMCRCDDVMLTSQTMAPTTVLSSTTQETLPTTRPNTSIRFITTLLPTTHLSTTGIKVISTDLPSTHAPDITTQKMRTTQAVQNQNGQENKLVCKATGDSMGSAYMDRYVV